MNGFDLIEGVNGVDEKLLSVPETNTERRRPRRLAWVLAAAALIVFGCVGVGASALIRGRFAPIKTGTHGYTAVFDLDQFKWSEFRGDIRETPAIIREQYATFTPQPLFSSVFVDPGSYAKEFPSFREAADYIGLKELKTPEAPFSADYIVGVHGDKDGNIASIDIFAQHIVMPSDPSTGRFGGALIVSILTGNSNSNTVNTGGDWGDYDPGRIDYKEFTTSKGVLCQYAEVGVGERARELLTGYVVDSGILYRLSISFDPGGYDTALEMLENWAEAF